MNALAKKFANPEKLFQIFLDNFEKCHFNVKTAVDTALAAFWYIPTNSQTAWMSLMITAIGSIHGQANNIFNEQS